MTDSSVSMSVRYSSQDFGTTPDRPGSLGATPRNTQPAASPEPRRYLSVACMAALLDQIDTGVLVCDAQAQVLLQNEAARLELAGGGVLELGADGILGVRGGASMLALRRAVHNAALENRHQLLPLRAGDSMLMLSVQPLRAGPLSQALAVLLLGRRELCPQLAVQELCRLFELTPAERQVLTELLSGAAVSSLAKRRGVEVSTVRTQVAALRTKLGVRRIDDLIRLVAELPPMMSALRYPAATRPGA